MTETTPKIFRDHGRPFRRRSDGSLERVRNSGTKVIALRWPMGGNDIIIVPVVVADEGHHALGTMGMPPQACWENLLLAQA